MAKRGFLDGYKTYDTSKGFGTLGDIGRAFDDVMGIEEAAQTLGDDNPLTILGLKKLPETLEALKKVYFRVIMAHQECQRADASPAQQEKVRKIIAAYSTLADRMKRANSR